MLTDKITGMTCGHCVKSVEKALAKVPGVDKVDKVDLATGEARIEGNPSNEAVLAAIRDEGYQATPVA